MAGAIFGRNLLQADAHGFQHIASAVQQIGVGLQPIEGKHAAGIRGYRLPILTKPKEVALRLEGDPCRIAKRRERVDLPLQEPTWVTVPRRSVLLPHPAADTAGRGEEGKGRIGGWIGYGEEFGTVRPEAGVRLPRIKDVVTENCLGEGNALLERAREPGSRD